MTSSNGRLIAAIQSTTDQAASTILIDVTFRMDCESGLQISLYAPRSSLSLCIFSHRTRGVYVYALARERLLKK